ncbi:unnamed protein product [Bubo scandiacus]
MDPPQQEINTCMEQGRHSFLYQRWDKGEGIQDPVGSLAETMRHNPKHYRERSDNAPVQWGNSGWIRFEDCNSPVPGDVTISEQTEDSHCDKRTLPFVDSLQVAYGPPDMSGQQAGNYYNGLTQ